jgi:tyrosyl-tRNA synthetase
MLARRGTYVNESISTCASPSPLQYDMENVLDVLRERGFVQQASEEDQLHSLLGRQPITLYCGYDPTNVSLTVGNLVTIMMLAHFQRCGHRPIVLMGGGTALIGDPSGKTASRPILSEGQIETNLQAQRRQLTRFLDFDDDRALLVNNAEWLVPLNFVAFMRDIGSRFSVNEILRLEAYRSRLDSGGLSFLEFSYVLMQSYDFLQLHERHGCVLQVGGSDQWGNSIAGADLIRRVAGGQAYVVVAPLLLTADGAKMGKSEAGAVWLDPQLTTPYEYYQYWRNTDDRDVARFLAIFTFLPMEEVQRLGDLQGADLNRAKETLAFEATRIVHGEKEAEKARAAAQALFGEASESAEVPTVEIAASRLADGLSVTELFREAGLVSSANEARSLIAQGGLSINGTALTDARARVDYSVLDNGDLMLSRGRKRHMRVVLRG